MQLIAISGPSHAAVAWIIAERWTGPVYRFSADLARARPIAVQQSIDATIAGARCAGSDVAVVHPVRTHAEADWIAARGGSLIVIERDGWPVQPLAERASIVLRDDGTLDDLRMRVVDVVSGLLAQVAA